MEEHTTTETSLPLKEHNSSVWPDDRDLCGTPPSSPFVEVFKLHDLHSTGRIAIPQLLPLFEDLTKAGFLKLTKKAALELSENLTRESMKENAPVSVSLNRINALVKQLNEVVQNEPVEGNPNLSQSIIARAHSTLSPSIYPKPTSDNSINDKADSDNAVTLEKTPSQQSRNIGRVKRNSVSKRIPENGNGLSGDYYSKLRTLAGSTSPALGSGGEILSADDSFNSDSDKITRKTSAQEQEKLFQDLYRKNMELQNKLERTENDYERAVVDLQKKYEEALQDLQKTKKALDNWRNKDKYNMTELEKNEKEFTRLQEAYVLQKQQLQNTKHELDDYKSRVERFEKILQEKDETIDKQSKERKKMEAAQLREQGQRGELEAAIIRLDDLVKMTSRLEDELQLLRSENRRLKLEKEQLQQDLARVDDHNPEVIPSIPEVRPFDAASFSGRTLQNEIAESIADESVQGEDDRSTAPPRSRGPRRPESAQRSRSEDMGQTVVDQTEELRKSNKLLNRQIQALKRELERAKDETEQREKELRRLIQDHEFEKEDLKIQYEVRRGVNPANVKSQSTQTAVEEDQQLLTVEQPATSPPSEQEEKAPKIKSSPGGKFYSNGVLMLGAATFFILGGLALYGGSRFLGAYRVWEAAITGVQQAFPAAYYSRLFKDWLETVVWEGEWNSRVPS